MRIIHAHKYYYLRAGAERYMFDLMEMQKKDGHQVIPFSMDYPKNLETPWSEFFVSELETEGGVKNPLKQVLRSLWSREAAKKFEALVDTVQPDIVHIHNIYTHISPSILKVCQKRGVPVVMTVQDYALVSANYSLWDRGAPMDLKNIGPLATARTRFMKGSYIATLALDLIYSWHRFWKSYENRIDKFFANSNFMKKVLVSDGLDESKIEPLHLFTEIPEDSSYQDDDYVLFFGRLEDYKGIQILIEAMKNYPDKTLKIAGTGPYEQNLREVAGDMPNIEFLGFVSGDARESLIRRARVCVVPSIWHEPFGLVAVEAMIRRTPVITSTVGGLQEIVESGVSGEKFRPGDADDLADKLRPFLHNKDHAKSFSQAAYDRAVEISGPEEHYKKVMGVYEDLIGKRQ